MSCEWQAVRCAAETAEGRGNSEAIREVCRAARAGRASIAARRSWRAARAAVPIAIRGLASHYARHTHLVCQFRALLLEDVDSLPQQPVLRPESLSVRVLTSSCASAGARKETPQ